LTTFQASASSAENGVAAAVVLAIWLGTLGLRAFVRR
jgi:hypothetical protein